MKRLALAIAVIAVATGAVAVTDTPPAEAAGTPVNVCSTTADHDEASDYPLTCGTSWTGNKTCPVGEEVIVRIQFEIVGELGSALILTQRIVWAWDGPHIVDDLIGNKVNTADKVMHMHNPPDGLTKVMTYHTGQRHIERATFWVEVGSGTLSPAPQPVASNIRGKVLCREL